LTGWLGFLWPPQREPPVVQGGNHAWGAGHLGDHLRDVRASLTSDHRPPPVVATHAGVVGYTQLALAQRQQPSLGCRHHLALRRRFRPNRRLEPRLRTASVSGTVANHQPALAARIHHD
jgi:hypothetical protein